jgi:dethiobiotin synthetase
VSSAPVTRFLGILGTGTGVGKSTLAVQWVRYLREAGENARAWKPLETGGDSDSRALAKASDAPELDGLFFREPSSPHRAARIEGRSIHFHERAAALERVSAGCTYFLIEAAGGAFTPLKCSGETNADLLEYLRIRDVVLVAADRLGALHDVLAVRAALPATLALRAVVLNDFAAPSAHRYENLAELRMLLRGVRIADGADLDFGELTRTCFT